MEIKTSKKTSEKSDLKSKTSTSSQKTKKVIVKRRTADLIPTKASAVAIAAQANREKEQELKKIASEKMRQELERISLEKMVNKRDHNSSSKIPLWVWLFFGCSLLLFCISFYQAIIRPQLVETPSPQKENSVYWVWDESLQNADNQELNTNNETQQIESNSEVKNGNKTDIVVRFFELMHSGDFEWSFGLLTSALQNNSDIRAHFREYRMKPFLSWIDGWKIQLSNFEYLSTSSYGNDKYSFDISYVLSSSQEKYDEKWEVVIDDKWEEPKIASIVCVTSRCSYHPIFWPENFGLMR